MADLGNLTSAIGTIVKDIEIFTLGVAAVGLVAGGAVIVNSSRNPSSYDDTSTTVFPADLINVSANRNFYMTFYFYQYQRPSIFQSVFPKPIGQIILPLPSNLNDVQAVSYDANQGLTPAVGAALDTMLQNERNTSGSFNVGNVFKQVGQTLLAGGQGAAIAVTATAANLAGKTLSEGNAANKAFQLGGLAVNPYLTVLFNSPTFKRHTFTWKFTPNNLQEANTLKYILNKFRYHQLPDTNTNLAGVLLNYPDMCVPIISPAGYMYSFKRCVIESAATSYAPGTTPGFTNAFTPSTVQLTVNLLEIEYWLKSDINSSDPNYTIPSQINTVQQ